MLEHAYGSGVLKRRNNELMRVLIVEDMKPMREVVKKMLQQMQCFEAIDEAEDGEKAWEIIVENADSNIYYDLVLCDVIMEKLDGIDLLKRCRNHENFRFLPFLMISGSSEGANITSALGEWAANDFIVKPFSFDLLSTRVDSLLKRAQSPDELLFRHMEQLRRDGDTKQAMALIEQAEMLNRISLAKWINAKGECLMQSGKPEEAAAAFEKATEISAIYIAAYKNYAFAHKKLGNIDKAIAALEHTEKMSPRDNERTFLLGQLMLQSGQTDAGKQYLDNLLKRCGAGEKESTLRKVAQVYLEGGLFKEAEEVYMSALEFNPSDLDLYNRLGVALRQQRKYDQALQCYLSALKKHPDQPGIYHNLGVLYMALKDYDTARRHFHRALAINPQFNETKTMLKKLEEIRARET